MMNQGPFHDEYCLSGCRLVRLRAEDARPVADMLAGMSPWLDLSYSAIQLENYLSAHDPSLHRYAVMVEAMVAGVVAVRYPWLRGSYLELIGLCTNQQGRGLGTAILQWMERETETLALNCWVLVSSFNESARRFYLRQGFREITTLEALVSRHSHELLLRKVLRLPA